MKLFNLKKNELDYEIVEDTTPNIGYFFKSLGRKFTKLISINLLAIFQFAPLIVAFFAYFWTETKPTIIDSSYPILQGISDFAESTPADIISLFLSSVQYRIPHETWGLLILMAGMYLLFVLTFGFWNVGLTYLMRELVNGKPVFIMSDMKYAIKRNFKQGLLYGIMDLAIMGILAYDLLYFYLNLGGGTMMYIFFFLTFAMCIVYTFMRMYIYLMMITFDLATFIAWSLYPLVGLVLLGGMLIFLAISQPAREKMERKFFL